MLYALKSKQLTKLIIYGMQELFVIKKTIPIFTFNFAAFVRYLFDFIKNNESKDHR